MRRRRGRRQVIELIFGPLDCRLLNLDNNEKQYMSSGVELGPEDVSLLERCPHFRGWYVQASMELGLEDVSLLERCPHFREWYVQASMELGPEEVSSFQRVVCTGFNGVGT